MKNTIISAEHSFDPTLTRRLSFPLFSDGLRLLTHDAKQPLKPVHDLRDMGFEAETGDFG